MQLPNGVMLQTGSFPPTAPPPDIDMPKLPPPSLEQQMEMKRRPFPRIVAAGIDEDPDPDPVQLFWEYVNRHWFGPNGKMPYFPPFNIKEFTKLEEEQQQQLPQQQQETDSSLSLAV
jgi:hypothetical protein